MGSCLIDLFFKSVLWQSNAILDTYHEQVKMALLNLFMFKNEP